MPSAELEPEAKFSFEVAKLLLQAVWADGQVADEEAEAIHDYAVRSGATASEVELLDSCLTGGQPLPPPDLSVLRGRRTEVLREVKKLLASDRRIQEEEEELLAEMSLLLE